MFAGTWKSIKSIFCCFFFAVCIYFPFFCIFLGVFANIWKNMKISRLRAHRITYKNCIFYTMQKTLFLYFIKNKIIKYDKNTQKDIPLGDSTIISLIKPSPHLPSHTKSLLLIFTHPFIKNCHFKPLLTTFSFFWVFLKYIQCLALLKMYI